MTISEKYLIGYLAGIIHGISLRDDVPQEVRNTCSMAYKKYEEFYKPSDNMVKCYRCYGTGRHGCNTEKTCSKCNGTGKVARMEG